jgi:hypothetical protein
MNAICGEKIARRRTEKVPRDARRDFSERASNPYVIAVFSISIFCARDFIFKIGLRFAHDDHARVAARCRAEFARTRTPFVKWSRCF